MVRNIIRIIDFGESGDGYIATHESMLYVFDGSFMLFVVVLLVLVHRDELFGAVRRAGKMEGWGVSNEMVPLAQYKR